MVAVNPVGIGVALDIYSVAEDLQVRRLLWPKLDRQKCHDHGIQRRHALLELPSDYVTSDMVT